MLSERCLVVKYRFTNGRKHHFLLSANGSWLAIPSDANAVSIGRIDLLSDKNPLAEINKPECVMSLPSMRVAANNLELMTISAAS